MSSINPKEFEIQRYKSVKNTVHKRTQDSEMDDYVDVNAFTRRGYDNVASALCSMYSMFSSPSCAIAVISQYLLPVLFADTNTNTCCNTGHALTPQTQSLI